MRGNKRLHRLVRVFPHCVFLCALLLINACDGFRQARMDIDLTDQLPTNNYVPALKVVDDIATKYNMRCLSAEDASRDYGIFGIHLQSAVSEKGIFAIKLWEFGPVGATREYEAVVHDLNEALIKQFPKAPITMNPSYCQPPYVK